MGACVSSGAQPESSSKHSKPSRKGSKGSKGAKAGGATPGTSRGGQPDAGLPQEVSKEASASAAAKQRSKANAESETRGAEGQGMQSGNEAAPGDRPVGNGAAAEAASTSRRAPGSEGGGQAQGRERGDAARVEDALARRSGDGEATGSGQAPPPARRLTYKELQVATNNFDEEFLLGEGSFGKVYQGLLEEWQLAGGVGEGEEGEGAPDRVREGRDVVKLAIKKLNPESFQGYEEWLAEVLLLDKLRHTNLVRLVGYCAERGEALLAYELCPHGSLDQALFEGLADGSVLSWEHRVNVARDAARGLAYLHENNVIHRDFKPSNILLAEDLSGRLTDFGMARAGPDGGETHISTRVMGTMGYLDPTYMETGRLTRKSDTYAFGVMLLELLTGRRSMGDDGGESLTAWVRPLLSQRRPDLGKLVDPRLEGKYSPAGAVKMAILAKHCIHDDPGYRPEMSTLAENLQLVDVKAS